MLKGPDYQAEMDNQWQENLEAFWENPMARLDSAKKLAQKRGLSLEVIRHWMCTDERAAYQFAIDPTKQTFHQSVAARWIAALPFVHDFKIPPTSGENALYVIDGRIVRGAELTNKDQTKSVDFIWQISLIGCQPLLFFASHKYTHECGGAQDNQFNDLLAFTKEAGRLQKEVGYRILSLADGAFYCIKRKGVLVSRLEELKNILHDNPFTGAMTCADLPGFMELQIRQRIQEAGRSVLLEEEAGLTVLREMI